MKELEQIKVEFEKTVNLNSTKTKQPYTVYEDLMIILHCQ
jgi:hypothetical protein